jgi:hypothetical protein
MIAPAVKSAKAARMRGLRPKICERSVKVGWKTVLESKKEVPDQKAWMAVPWRTWDIFY